MTVTTIADTTTRTVTVTILVKGLPTRQFPDMDAADGIIATDTNYPAETRAG